MARKRAIQAAEAPLWLAVLLDYSFSGKGAQRAARIDLLGVAHDVTVYPDDIRLAELILRWAEQYVPPDDWRRLQARVRKKRSFAL